MQNNSLSPIVSNLNEALRGRDLIRFMGSQQYFSGRHHKFMDKFITCEYSSASILNCGNLIGGWLAFLLSTTCAALAVVLAKDYDRDQLALALTYCFIVPLFAAFVGQVSNMTAVTHTHTDPQTHESKMSASHLGAATTEAHNVMHRPWTIQHSNHLIGWAFCEFVRSCCVRAEWAGVLLPDVLPVA